MWVNLFFCKSLTVSFYPCCIVGKHSKFGSVVLNTSKYIQIYEKGIFWSSCQQSKILCILFTYFINWLYINIHMYFKRVDYFQTILSLCSCFLPASLYYVSLTALCSCYVYLLWNKAACVRIPFLPLKVEYNLRQITYPF